MRDYHKNLYVNFWNYWYKAVIKNQSRTLEWLGTLKN